MSAWDEVEQFKQRHAMLVTHLACDLVRLGWTLVFTDEGQWGARRLCYGVDPEECLVRDGAPEARGQTPAILLATVQALAAEDRAERAVRRATTVITGQSGVPRS